MHVPVSLSLTSLPCAPPKYKRIKDYLYDMEAVLGKGNFSTVYRATRETTRTPSPYPDEAFAVKVVQLASLTFKKLEELLEQEISIIRSLDHPNVIRCVEVLKSANHCYFITELCDSGSLEKTLRERGPLCEEELWPLVNQLFQGLKYLSSRNIVHRDIKSHNVLIDNNL
jgi:serine/threonine-protein kinase ULK/ATG1